MFMCGPAFWQQFDEGGGGGLGELTIFEGFEEDPDAHPSNAATAEKATFISYLASHTEEDFEGYTELDVINAETFTHNGVGCTFGGDILSSISITVLSDVSGSGLGRFNTTPSGVNWADGIIMSQDYPLEFNFSPAIALFGLYITDLGDFGVGAVTQVRLTKSAASGGGTSLHNVTQSASNINGTLHFWGFIDPSATYDKVELLRDVSSVDDSDVLTDAIGIDDVIFAPASYIL